MPSILDTMEHSRRLVREFCLAEIQIADAILDHVKAYPATMHREESLAHAIQARNTVARLLERPEVMGDELGKVRELLRLFDVRLEKYRQG